LWTVLSATASRRLEAGRFLAALKARLEAFA